jgi:transposase
MTRREYVIQEYMKGTPVDRIAKVVDRTRQACYLMLAKLPNYSEVKEAHREQRRIRNIKELTPPVLNLWKNSKLTATDISTELGVPYYIIGKILRTELGKRPRKNDQRDTQIVREYLEGKSQKELAKKYKTVQPNINRVLKRYLGSDIASYRGVDRIKPQRF